MKYVGIDLHTNRFTCCYLDEEGNKEIKTFNLDEKDLELFIGSVNKLTYVLIEATINSFAFVKRIEEHVKEVIVANSFEIKNISFTNKPKYYRQRYHAYYNCNKYQCPIP